MYQILSIYYTLFANSNFFVCMCVCVYVYICVYISICIYCAICIRVCGDSYTVRMIVCMCLYIYTIYKLHRCQQRVFQLRPPSVQQLQQSA